MAVTISVKPKAVSWYLTASNDMAWISITLPTCSGTGFFNSGRDRNCASLLPRSVERLARLVKI